MKISDSKQTGTILIISGVLITFSFSINFNSVLSLSIAIIALLMEIIGVFIIVRTHILEKNYKKLIPPFIGMIAISGILFYYLYFIARY